MESAQRNADETRRFFEQWSVCQRVLEHNYLRHREAYAEVGKLLRGGGSFIFYEPWIPGKAGKA